MVSLLHTRQGRWMGMVTRCPLRGGSRFLIVLIAVRNPLYRIGTEGGSFVLVGLYKVVPKWFQRWFRFGRWFRLVPFGVVPTG